jgi:hypothetical protein
MAQGQTVPTSLIESDRIEGTPVYAGQGSEIGAIKRVIIDKASGRVVYVVITFVSSFGLGDVPYVIAWAKLSYDRSSGGYRTDITEAQLSGAPAAAQGDPNWADRESVETLEAFYRIPPGWRSV